MSDETPQPVEEEIELLQSTPEIDFMQDTMDGLLAAASVDAVYGEPVKKGDTLVIPAAEVLAGGAFGLGSGSGGNQESGNGQGIGGGGGGRSFARPVAVIIVSPEGVRVEPVLDLTKVALAFLTAIAMMLGMALRFLNPSKALKDMQNGGG
jgi:uncharacterized spore protein YtfJ